MNPRNSIRKTTLALAVTGVFIAPAFAQTTPAPAATAPASSNFTETEAARNVRDQQRIDNGLKSGQLNTREAAKLENQQSHIDQQQSRYLENGDITAQQKAKLNAEQHQASEAIHAEKNNAVTGNPNSASSERLQHDVGRDVSQQTRIQNGVNDGTLNTHEAGALERGQARGESVEARAAANGHVHADEQHHVASVESRQNARIAAKRHN